jgi:hypothetical protein
MNLEIVISAYDKPLDWLNLLDDKTKITIYRKGNEFETSDSEIMIEKNIGRDVHTFFYHIVKNYENLSDLTFFSQDYPFDHFENIIEVINKKTWEENACVKFDGYYGFHYNSINTPNFVPNWPLISNLGGKMWNLEISKDHYGGRVLVCNSNGSPHDLGNNVNVNTIFTELFNSPHALNRYEFVPGGHFAITKECVQKREKKFYEKIIHILERDLNAPWNIERLECYIFNSNLYPIHEVS